MQIVQPQMVPHTEPSRVGYARVSTSDQDLRMQIDALVKDGVPEGRIYKETVSGAKASRPEFGLMMRELQAGDVVTVWKLDRLSRSLSAMLRTVDIIHRRGAALRVLTQQIDTTTASGRCFLQMLGVIAEFEREIGRERTAAGVAAARKRGRFGGQPFKYSDEDVRRVMAHQEQGASWAAAAALIGISVQRLRSRAREIRRSEERDRRS